MCTTYIYTYVHPDGRREQVRRPALCPVARHGQPCVDNVVLQHPTQYVPSSSLPSYTSYFPPTPPAFTPRSGTPSYRSGDESDRSYHSSSSNRRRSGVYINGQRVLDLNRRDRDRHLRRERIVLVDNPPTPRTPPQAFNFPNTAPSSPNVNPFSPHIVDASPRDSYTRRPVIVDERPRVERPSVQIEVVEPRPPRRSNTHMRHSSTSSRESGRPTYPSAEEEELRQRRREREAIRQERRLREAQEKEQKEREAREKTIRDLRMRQRIADANAEIANRPAVPMPPAPKRASTFVAAKAAREAQEREADLIDAVRRLDLEEKRRAKRVEREEDEEQRARLRERMVPRRRATVGPGSRRHRVLYDDGIYRWE
ncbi:hypothetical protein PLIIFM63780_005121 [Purpureocillium lilacinum]|nr:hypothetical protein PLIIFM63780_005121 [Purpureocillium lilacinum]